MSIPTCAHSISQISNLCELADCLGMTYDQLLTFASIRAGHPGPIVLFETAWFDCPAAQPESPGRSAERYAELATISDQKHETAVAPLVQELVSGFDGTFRAQPYARIDAFRAYA